MRRSGRRMNRKDRDREGEMRLTERTRKLNLIPETRRGVPKGAIGPMRREDDVGGLSHTSVHAGYACHTGFQKIYSSAMLLLSSDTAYKAQGCSVVIHVVKSNGRTIM